MLVSSLVHMPLISLDTNWSRIPVLAGDKSRCSFGRDVPVHAL
jgi:hypothetical protein